MSEAKHTPGELVIGPMPRESGLVGIYAGPRRVAEFILPGDARRLVACWNACEGLDIDALESVESPADLRALAGSEMDELPLELGDDS